MAVMGTEPRMVTMLNNNDLLEIIRASSFIEGDLFENEPSDKDLFFREYVLAGTYPRSGLHHPTLAIGDHIEFVSKRSGLMIFDSTKVFRITSIDLDRAIDSLVWEWVIGVNYSSKQGQA
jgi:hypothetical protein